MLELQHKEAKQEAGAPHPLPGEGAASVLKRSDNRAGLGGGRRHSLGGQSHCLVVLWGGVLNTALPLFSSTSKM